MQPPTPHLRRSTSPRSWHRRKFYERFSSFFRYVCILRIIVVALSVALDVSLALLAVCVKLILVGSSSRSSSVVTFFSVEILVISLFCEPLLPSAGATNARPCCVSSRRCPRIQRQWLLIKLGEPRHSDAFHMCASAASLYIRIFDDEAEGMDFE